nr:MAG TPA: hypothetical protein [Caudoviricetes sp.]
MVLEIHNFILLYNGKYILYVTINKIKDKKING